MEDGLDNLPKGEVENTRLNDLPEVVCKGREMWFSSGLSPINYFSSLSHEIGHVLRDELSFKEGEVLSPGRGKKE